VFGFISKVIERQWSTAMANISGPYTPHPIETSKVELDAQVIALTELLAQNVHDQWGRRRLIAGWKWGHRRDEEQKEHPCLMPYGELPETEKEYDRSTAMETLKAMVALGYRIKGPAQTTAEPPAEADLQRLLARLLDACTDLADLLALWRGKGDQAAIWASAPEAYRLLAERLLKLGAPLLGAEVVREGLSSWPNDIRLRQLHGLSQARCGATERANRILRELCDEGQANEETLGILARTHKDLGLVAADPTQRQRQLRLSLETYLKAYNQHGGYWTGINASTVSTLLGEHDRSKNLAREVRTSCLKKLDELEQSGGDMYWELATLGEAALNLGDWAEAERWYARAAEVGRNRYGDLSSTRKQAKVLLAHLKRDPAIMDRWLPLPNVVVFAGHMIDQPSRPQPRFPASPEMEEAVYRSIIGWLRTQSGLIGYASAACGSDILFLEAILELNGEAHVVLPYDPETFGRDSVSIVPGADWATRFEKVLSRATQVVQASGTKMDVGSISYDYANLVLHGLATVRSGELDTALVALAVWDGREGDGPGGTAAVVRRWHHLGLPVVQINIAPGHASSNGEWPIVTVPPPALLEAFDSKAAKSDTRVMAMLFADAVNYRTLTEEQVPRFVQHFLGAIADLMRRQPTGAVVKNTWGDGLYLVFNDVQTAGVFALDLCDLVTGPEADWGSKGLPKGLSMRIALHAGPVYGCQDPITGNWNYTGTHVSRAARIEPITDAGQVYASEAFAALAAVERARGFTCEFVKHAGWAKGYGTYPTYQVRRAR
jgi:class 3 adenylate cyclase/tetratricopeptide (TPR) repeat protein